MDLLSKYLIFHLVVGFFIGLYYMTKKDYEEKLDDSIRESNFTLPHLARDKKVMMAVFMIFGIICIPSLIKSFWRK